MVAASNGFIEAGCDFITATSKSSNTKNLLYQTGLEIVSLERLAGCDSSDWQALGYRGIRSGSASVGVGEQGTIVRLSSAVARDYFQDVICHAENCSRFDLQTTVRLNIPPARFVASQFKAICSHEEKFKRPKKVKLILSRTGAETIMLGSRQSDRYGRIYDKHAESGLEHYRNCVRLEIEFKNGFARANAAACAANRAQPAWVHSQVCTWISRRGGQLGSIPTSALVHCTPQNKVDVPGLLRYIHLCVRPVLSRAIRLSSLDEVLNAAGLSEYLIENQRKIL